MAPWIEVKFPPLRATNFILAHQSQDQELLGAGGNASTLARIVAQLGHKAGHVMVAQRRMMRLNPSRLAQHLLDNLSARWVFVKPLAPSAVAIGIRIVDNQLDPVADKMPSVWSRIPQRPGLGMARGNEGWLHQHRFDMRPIDIVTSMSPIIS